MTILTREILPPAAELPRLTRLGDLFSAFEEDAAARHAAYTSGVARGPVTRLGALDKELGGALAPGLHFWHGAAGTGKSALALQVGASTGCPCLFVTCEMAPLELLRRVAARVTETYLGKFKSGELSPAEAMAKVRRAATAAERLVLADATQAFAAPEWLRDAARAARGEHPHLLIIIDSLHSWAEGVPGAATEYETLNAGIQALRTLARQLDCPIVCIAERNRASMKSGGLSAGAGSRKIEYSGESVLDLDADPDAVPDGNGEVPVTLKLAKNRSGVAGRKITLKFHGGFQRFRSV